MSESAIHVARTASAGLLESRPETRTCSRPPIKAPPPGRPKPIPSPKPPAYPSPVRPQAPPPGREEPDRAPSPGGYPEPNQPGAPAPPGPPQATLVGRDRDRLDRWDVVDVEVAEPRGQADEVGEVIAHGEDPAEAPIHR